MRMTQIYGRTEEAEKFLEENVEMIPDVSCPDCGKIISYKQNRQVYKDESDSGMFGDGPKLWEYILKNGKAVYEKLNDYRPWSSGPCLFIDIVDEHGVLYGWSSDEINESI